MADLQNKAAGQRSCLRCFDLWQQPEYFSPFSLERNDVEPPESFSEISGVCCRLRLNQQPIMPTCDHLCGGGALQADCLCYHGDGVQGPRLQAVQLSGGDGVL